MIPLQERVDSRQAALILVDVQNDYCHPEGAVARRGKSMEPIDAAVGKLETLLEEARKVGLPVVWIRTTNNEWTMSEAWQEQRSSVPEEGRYPCMEGTWGAEYYRISPQPGEREVTKHRYSAFINTDLDTILRSRNIRTLLMTGVATNVCVESTARDGFMHDYRIVLVEDCCGTSDRVDQEATVRNIGGFFGTVERSDAVIAAWAATGARVAAR